MITAFWSSGHGAAKPWVPWSRTIFRGGFRGWSQRCRG